MKYVGPRVSHNAIWTCMVSLPATTVRRTPDSPDRSRRPERQNSVFGGTRSGIEADPPEGICYRWCRVASARPTMFALPAGGAVNGSDRTGLEFEPGRSGGHGLDDFHIAGDPMLINPRHRPTIIGV